jgi:16S rRNA (uracil1498-N3)-methyltransferase
MYNFFVERDQFYNHTVDIKDENFNHIKNVLRMKIDDELIVSCKETGNSFLCTISEIGDNKIVCKIIEERESTEPKVEVTLFQGIPKSDKMELIIQKTVEVGINKIYPVEMKFCIGKVKDNKKITRWQTISEAAAKQSKRNIIPTIENPISFKEMAEVLKEYDLALVAYENEEKTNIKEVLQQNPDAKKIAIIIGPEGGISKEEVESLVSNGTKEVSLGKRILRTETASISMLSMIMYQYDL